MLMWPSAMRSSLTTLVCYGELTIYSRKEDNANVATGMNYNIASFSG